MTTEQPQTRTVQDDGPQNTILRIIEKTISSWRLFYALGALSLLLLPIALFFWQIRDSSIAVLVIDIVGCLLMGAYIRCKPVS